MKWVKNDEIFFNNRMFDVKRIVPRGDYFAFVGHYDKKDDGFRSLIARFFDTSETERSPDGKSINFLALEAIVPVSGLDLHCVVEDEVPVRRTFHSIFCGLDVREPAIQPPEIA